MTRQMQKKQPAGRDDRAHEHPGTNGCSKSLSVLWELFHDSPSLPSVAVAGTLLHSWE